MRIVCYGIMIFLLFSCKKDKLKGDTALLEGKWKWVYSEEYKTNPYTGQTTIQIISASNYPDSYELEFDRKGKVRYLKNSNVECEYRTVFGHVNNENCSFGDCIYASINLNNSKKDRLVARFNQNILTLATSIEYLPLSSFSTPTHDYVYTNYFIRSN